MTNVTATSPSSPTPSLKSPKNNIDILLSAEFDNKLGSILKCAYPTTIPGLDPIYNDNTFNLATLMLPDNMEKFPGKLDFTFFNLYYNKTSKCYQLFPPPLIGELDSTEVIYFINICNTVLNEEDERGATIKSIALGSKSSSNMIKWKPFLAILLEDLMKCTFDFGNTAENNEEKILSIFMERMNKLIFTDLIIDNSVKQIIRSINDGNKEQSLIHNLLDHVLQESNNIENTVLEMPVLSKQSNETIHYQLEETIPPRLSPLFYKVPIDVKVVSDSFIPMEISYNKFPMRIIRQLFLEFPNLNHITTIMIYSAKISKDCLCQLIYTISFLISGLSPEHNPIYGKVLTVPYIDISGVQCLQDYIKSNHNMKKIVVGVANPIFKIQENVYDILIDVDYEEIQLSSKVKLKHSEWKSQPFNFFAKSYKLNKVNINHLSRGINNLSLRNKSISKFSTSIANTTTTYDNRSDISLSNNIANSGDSVSRPSLGVVPSSIIPPPPPALIVSFGKRVTLMVAFIQLLIWEQHDNRTILNIMKRIQILQMIPLLEKINEIRLDESMSKQIFSVYKETYQDIIVFDELFTVTRLKFIKLLFSLSELLRMIMDKNFYPSDSLTEHDKAYSKISQLFDVIKQIHSMINDNDGSDHLNELIYICLNFPHLGILSAFDIKTKDFKSFNINKFFFEVSSSSITNKETEFSLFKTGTYSDFRISATNDNNYGYPTAIDQFGKIGAFDLLGNFLRFLPELNSRSISPLTSPSKKRNNRLSISRSMSFRNLFSLKVPPESGTKSLNQSPKLKDTKHRAQLSSTSVTVRSSTSLVLQKPPSHGSLSTLPKQSLSFESINTSLRVSSIKDPLCEVINISHVLETRIEKIKRMIYEIFDIIGSLNEGVNVGKNLLRLYLNEEIWIYIDNNNREKVGNRERKGIPNNNASLTKRNTSLFTLGSHDNIDSKDDQSELSIVSSMKKNEPFIDTQNKIKFQFKKNSISSSENEDEEEIIFYEIQNL